MSRLRDAFLDGLWRENPVFWQVLGICSALAVTTRVENALYMGAAVTVVAMGSNMMVSLLRRFIPRDVRLMVEMVIIAGFVALFDLYLKAFSYPMSQQLGPYVGLIVTNCIILGRTEAFALKNGVMESVADGLGNGLGYSAVLVVIAVIREVGGSGTFLGHQVLPAGAQPMRVLVAAPGAFIIMSLLAWAFQYMKEGRRV